MSLKCILQGQDSKNLVTKVELNEHIADKNNPHEVTAEQVGALSKEVISLPDGTDFNNIVNTGLYKVFTGINAPIGGVGNYKAFMVLVASELVSEPRLTQLAISYYQKEQSNRIFIRTIRDEWSDWRELSSADQLCNPNLLDNWYFVNPVNQRGQTEYTGGGYCIDRWIRSFDGKSTLSLSEGGIKITSGATSWNNFEQKLENFPANTTVTISFLVDDTANINQVYVIKSSQQMSTFTPANKNLFTLTTNVGDNPSNNGVGIQVKTDKTAIIYAAKLELGDHQTLAHKEGDTWVLNEIPDFGEQLARCQRYYFVTNANHFFSGWCTVTEKIWTHIPTPVPMRAIPAISVIAPGHVIFGTSGANLLTSANQYEIENADATGIKMAVNIAGLSLGAGILCDGKYAFSADL